MYKRRVNETRWYVSCGVIYNVEGWKIIIIVHTKNLSMFIQCTVLNVICIDILFIDLIQE